MSLGEAMTPLSAVGLSPFSGVVVVASLFRRTLLHSYRSNTDDRDDDLNGDFWKSHRIMDSILLNTLLHLPSHLRLPLLSPSSNIIFLNMSLHAATICLHQVAVFKAEKYGLASTIGTESRMRCVAAAGEIAQIMKSVAHLDLSTVSVSCFMRLMTTNTLQMNPFVPFCLYVAAQVLLQYITIQPKDDNAKSSLQFLLSAMTVIKSTNPLAASFLVQLDVDLEGSGVEAPAKQVRSRVGEKKQCMVRIMSWFGLIVVGLMKFNFLTCIGRCLRRRE